MGIEYRIFGTWAYRWAVKLGRSVTPRGGDLVSLTYRPAYREIDGCWSCTFLHTHALHIIHIIYNASTIHRNAFLPLTCKSLPCLETRAPGPPVTRLPACARVVDELKFKHSNHKIRPRANHNVATCIGRDFSAWSCAARIRAWTTNFCDCMDILAKGPSSFGQSLRTFSRMFYHTFGDYYRYVLYSVLSIGELPL